MKYKLDSATITDVDRLINYKKDTIFSSSDNLSNDEINKINEYVINSVNKDINDYKIVILDNKKIGSLLIKNIDEGLFIDEIYLEKEYRFLGIGTSILKGILEKHNDKDIYLWVYKNNNVALSLYKKLDFIVKDETEYRYYMVHKSIH